MGGRKIPLCLAELPQRCVCRVCREITKAEICKNRECVVEKIAIKVEIKHGIFV